MPGDLRTLIGFITFDSTVHFYSLKVSDYYVSLFQECIKIKDICLEHCRTSYCSQPSSKLNTAPLQQIIILHE